jgi:hypothetical protein
VHRQKGLTLSGFVLWAFLLIVVLLLGFKLAPSYFEYYDIEKQLRAIAEDPASRTGDRHAIEGAFARRATIENIQSVAPSDLDIAKQADGVVISASYTVRVPLFGNVSACLDFNPSSAK